MEPTTPGAGGQPEDGEFERMLQDLRRLESRSQELVRDLRAACPDREDRADAAGADPAD